jgi:hypothetical protein
LQRVRALLLEGYLSRFIHGGTCGTRRVFDGCHRTWVLKSKIFAVENISIRVSKKEASLPEMTKAIEMQVSGTWTGAPPPNETNRIEIEWIVFPNTKTPKTIHTEMEAEARSTSVKCSSQSDSSYRNSNNNNRMKFRKNFYLESSRQKNGGEFSLPEPKSEKASTS